MGSTTRALRGARWAALLIAGSLAATIALARSGTTAPPPWLAPALASALMGTAAFAVVAAVAGAGRSGIARLGEAALFVGVLVIGGAGLSNWAFGYRGYVVATEGEEVVLASGAELQELAGGPRARVRELAGGIRLVEIRLVPAPDGGFVPESRIVVTRPGAAAAHVTVTTDRGAEVGPVVLHQGAFGFVPRVVVHRGGATVLDRSVHFTSRKVGGSAVSFEAKLDLGDGVLLEAAIDLAALDQDMRGHPRLAVALHDSGRLVGAGTLLPGHGADLEGGWHVGFAGSKMWSEIDVVRRSYRTHVLVGLALVVFGAVAWAFAAIRST